MEFIKNSLVSKNATNYSYKNVRFALLTILK